MTKWRGLAMTLAPTIVVVYMVLIFVLMVVSVPFIPIVLLYAYFRDGKLDILLPDVEDSDA